MTFETKWIISGWLALLTAWGIVLAEASPVAFALAAGASVLFTFAGIRHRRRRQAFCSHPNRHREPWEDAWTCDSCGKVEYLVISGRSR